jgi:hypothetical protein
VVDRELPNLRPLGEDHRGAVRGDNMETARRRGVSFGEGTSRGGTGEAVDGWWS